MSRLRWFTSVALVLAAGLPVAALGQDRDAVGTPNDPHHSVISLPVVHTLPGMDEVRVVREIPFSAPDGDSLFYDLYLPPGFDAGTPSPVIVFVNGAGNRGGRRLKEWPVYRSWLRLTAAYGLPAVMCDTRFSHAAEDFALFMEHLRDTAGSRGLDPERMGLWACSSNVGTALDWMMDPTRTFVRAAAIYYGRGDVPSIRNDLPLLYVLAGRDNADLNESIRTLVGRALTGEAPWRFIPYPDGRHAFDVLDDTAETRLIIDQTLAFLETFVTDPVGDPVLPPSLARDALGPWFSQEYAEAATAYRRYVERYPGDGLGWSRLATSELNLGNNGAAAEAYARAAQADYRVRGSLYNRACALALDGDADNALAALEAAFDAGFDDNEQPRLDPDLRILLADARLRILLDAHTTRSTVSLVDAQEPGERLRVTGTVSDGDGNPIPGAQVFVHQTNDDGLYALDQGPTPRLFGSMITDEDGSYAFDTVRPGAYPSGDIPRHIHYRVQASGYEEVVFEVLFADDPLVRGAAHGRDLVVQPRAGSPTDPPTAVADVVLRRGQP